jgi:hypothetical protein
MNKMVCKVGSNVLGATAGTLAIVAFLAVCFGILGLLAVCCMAVDHYIDLPEGIEFAFTLGSIGAISIMLIYTGFELSRQNGWTSKLRHHCEEFWA